MTLVETCLLLRVPNGCGFNSLSFSCLSSSAMRSASTHVCGKRVSLSAPRFVYKPPKQVANASNWVFSFSTLQKRVFSKLWQSPVAFLPVEERYPYSKAVFPLLPLPKSTYCSCTTQLNARGATTTLGDSAVDTLLTKSSHPELLI